MMNRRRPFARACALLLCAAVLLAPAVSLAGETDFDTAGLRYVALEGDENSYQENPSVNVPEGGFPENDWVEGTNPLTGEDWSGVYQPIFFDIDTDPRARPNYGVSDADIIYEFPVHRQGNTRSFALFMGVIPPQGVGPIRSARIAMIDIAEEWHAGYAFYGMQEQKGTSVKDYVRQLHPDGGVGVYPYIDLMPAKYNDYNERTEYFNPHNIKVDVAALLAAVATDPPQMRPWKFSDKGLDRGASAYAISMEFRPEFAPSFRYNEETRSYDRYYNGEPFIDANNGKLCTFANVIVMRTDFSWYRNNPSRPVIKLTGQGVAEIFMNGRYIRGSWVRALSNKGDPAADIAARTVFLDENGEEISFLPGKTFIHVVAVDQPVVVANDPSAGDPLTAGRQVPAPTPTPIPVPTRTPRPTRTPKPGVEDTPAPVTPAEEGGNAELPGE